MLVGPLKKDGTRKGRVGLCRLPDEEDEGVAPAEGGGSTRSCSGARRAVSWRSEFTELKRESTWSWSCLTWSAISLNSSESLKLAQQFGE
jgi:hypothetical protein